MSFRSSGVIELQVDLRLEAVLHFLGYPEDRMPPRRLLLDEALEEARRSVQPRGSYTRWSPAQGPRFGLPSGALLTEGATAEAKELVIGLVTVGAALETRAEEQLRAGSATRALLLEAAGSAAAEEAADGLMMHALESSGMTDQAPVLCRVSPGYGAWPLDAQQSIFDILPHEELGVRLLPSLLMVPRKSISFAFWLDEAGRPFGGFSGCSACGMNPCPYRKAQSPTVEKRIQDRAEEPGHSEAP